MGLGSKDLPFFLSFVFLFFFFYLDTVFENWDDLMIFHLPKRG